MKPLGSISVRMAGGLLVGLLLSASGHSQTTSATILFLHHSTGGNLFSQGQVGEWFESYNAAHGTSYQIEERSYPDSPYPWNNYPYDYWHLWVDPTTNYSDLGRASLTYLTQQHGVIISKHCFPGADIQPDTGTPSVSSERKSLENYRLQYRALRSKFASYPNTTFIVWTLVPLHRLATDAATAGRARQFADWVKNDWLTEDGVAHPNVYVFDFWGYAAEAYPNPTQGQVNTLRYEFEGNHNSSDSHPNALANQTIGPLFARFVLDAVRSSGVCSGAPDETTPGVPWKAIANAAPTYTWNKIGCATWYQLRVDGPSGTVINRWYTAAQANCLGGNCSVTPSTGLASGDHTWWVRTWNASGYGPWSTPQHFSVSGTLTAAVPILPSEVIGDSTPAYIWSEANAATWYYLWVNNSAGNPVVKQWYTLAQATCGGGSCAVSPSTQLADGNYTWWVQTWNSSGYGPWSAARSFTLSGCRPGKTVLIAPTGGVANPPPYYWWYDVGNATWYYLWVNGPSGSPAVQRWYTAAQASCNGKWCWVNNPAVLPSGANTWWVQAYGSCSYGPWSAGQGFTVPTTGAGTWP